MRNMGLLLFIAVVSGEFFQPAYGAIENSTQFVMCRSGVTVRTLRIKVSDDDGSCKALYSKGGVDKVVGYGRNANSCRPFVDNIQSNLEGANWNCKPMAKVTVMVPEEEAPSDSGQEKPNDPEDDGELDD